MRSVGDDGDDDDNEYDSKHLPDQYSAYYSWLFLHFKSFILTATLIDASIISILQM